MAKKVTVDLKGMTPEERRNYNRVSKQRSRDREKEARVAAQVPEARNYLLPASQRDELLNHAEQLTRKIREEIGTEPDGFIVEMIAAVLLGHENNWTKKVHSPTGVLYCGYFADGAASTVIEYVHRNPVVKNSQTFTELYEKFQKTCKALSRNTSWFSPEYAEQIKAELDGTYKLPVVEKPEPPKVAEPKTVTPPHRSNQPQG